MSAASYGINIPVAVNGREQLAQVDAAIRGVSGATKGLSADQKAFADIVRSNVILGKDYIRTLDSLRAAKSGVSKETKDLAAALQAYVVSVRAANEETKKFEAQQAATQSKLLNLGGSVGARIGGMASGVPGGGFIGANIARTIGGGAGLAFGGALLGTAAVAEIIRITTETAKYAQAQTNLAAETGLSVQQTQLFGHVAEMAGVQVNSLTTVSRKLYDAMTNGGAEAEKTKRALQELGLTATVAFEPAQQQLSDLLGALKKVSDQGERVRLARNLGVEDILPLVDSFSRLATEVKNTGVVMDQFTTTGLARFKETLGTLTLAWDKLSQSAAIGAAATVDAIRLLDSVGLDPTGIGRLFRPAQPQQQSTAEFAAQALVNANQTQVAQARAGTMATLDGIDKRQRTPVEQLQLEHKQLEEQAADMRQRAISTTDPRDVSNYDSLRRQIQSNEASTKTAEEYASQQRALRDLKRESSGTLDNQGAEKLFPQLPRRFSLITGTPEYQSFRSDLIPMVKRGIQDENASRIRSESEKLLADPYKALNQDLDKTVKERNEFQERQARNQLQASLDVIRGSSAQGDARLRQQLAIQGAGAAARARTLTPTQLAGLDLSQTQAANSAEYNQKFGTLGAEFLAQSQAAGAAPFGSSLRAESDARAKELNIQLNTLEIDAKTKSIDAINKFNDALEKADEAMSKEFAGGFASIIMGAQNKGGKGAEAALRGFAEKQEETILKNIGQQLLYPTFKGALGGGSDSKLLQGTIFEKTGTKATVQLTDSSVIFGNTDSTERNTTATLALNATMQTRLTTANATPSVIYDGQGNAIATAVPAGTPVSSAASALSGAAPYAGSILDVTAAANAGSVAAKAFSGTPTAMIASAGKSLSQLGAALLSGGLKAGDISAIAGTAEVPYVQNGQAVPGLTTSESTTQQVGAILGTAGLGVAAVQGILTASQGGAKNVTGGTAAAVAAITPIAAGVAKALGAASSISSDIPIVGAAVSSVLGLVSSFIPSGQTQRSKQIANTIFGRTYLAPQAQNITESGNAGYSDFDINGNVRTSSFSPYPIISQSYGDVPRKVVVPGHTLSPFGGYQNVTGAKTPSAPTYNMTIQSFDSRDVISHGAAIADALHSHLSGSFHPLINTLAGQLGIR